MKNRPTEALNVIMASLGKASLQLTASSGGSGANKFKTALERKHQAATPDRK
jgi:hypothetical protein